MLKIDHKTNTWFYAFYKVLGMNCFFYTLLIELIFKKFDALEKTI